MSKYPYWKNRDVKKVVVVDLTMTEPNILEDGVFYDSSLEIVDSTGRPIPFRIQGQDQSETALAAEGVSGMFIPLKAPSNPCTVKYTPRFMIYGEDHEYIKSTFEHISGVDISNLVTNIDDLINESVTPDPMATLSLRNMSNANRVGNSIDRLIDRISKSYHTLDELPEAVEEVYLNSKGGDVEMMSALMDVKPSTLTQNDVMMSSIRILTRAPEGKLFGNYLYIAFTDNTFEYKDKSYTMCRGDVGIITSGDLTVYPYGSAYKERMTKLDAMVLELDKYADASNETLSTVAKDIESAVIEFREVSGGYFSDSLYIENDINDSRLFVGIPGTIIGRISESFTYEDVLYSVDDIILIANNNVVKIGVTESEYTKLERIRDNLESVNTSINSIFRPLENLSDMITKLYGIKIPSRESSEIVVDGDRLYIDGIDITSADIAESISGRLDRFSRGGYINNEKILKLISKSNIDDDRMSMMYNRITRLNALVDKMSSGQFTLIPNRIISPTGYYYDGNPISIADGVLTIRTVGAWSLPKYTTIKLRFFNKKIYIILDTGVFELNPSVNTIYRPIGFKTAKTATDVILYKSEIALVSPIELATLVETISETIVATGDIIRVGSPHSGPSGRRDG